MKKPHRCVGGPYHGHLIWTSGPDHATATISTSFGGVQWSGRYVAGAWEARGVEKGDPDPTPARPVLARVT